jgi:hypothetical protein
MDQIRVNVQGIRMAALPNGNQHLLLIAPNQLQADILQHTIGGSVKLSYTYDGTDITFYLVFELPRISKMFRIAINANTATCKWLNHVDEQKVTAIRIAYRDGKGSPVISGSIVPCSFTQ